MTGFGLTAIGDPMSYKINLESVAKQRFQDLSWLGCELKAL
jgi:hypothetical protein